MRITVNENRSLDISDISGTQNENNITEIELVVPVEYENYNKKIVFITGDKIVWDLIEDNKYKITKVITQYEKVYFYIWLTSGEDDFRSATYRMEFNTNKDASEEITEEEIGAVNKVVAILDEEVEKVTNLTTEIQAKLDNGEFDGKDYILTDEDKIELVGKIEADIQPTLNDIEDKAEHAEVIARGRATGYVFDTLEDLEIWLQDETNISNLTLGDNFYIRALNTPDYWWDGTSKQQLEAEKPDLSNLVDKNSFVYETDTETLSINI